MHFGWAHDFWRRMGWLELMGWLGTMRRHQEGARTAPGSWDGADRDPWWVEARKARADSRR